MGSKKQNQAFRPGDYTLPPLTGYKDHDITKYRNPAYSIGLRIKGVSKFVTPGPPPDDPKLRYDSKNKPGYTIKSRPKPLEPFRTPGPYMYTYRTGPWPPAYSLAFRQPPLKPFVTPGPNQYRLPKSMGCFVPDKQAGPCYSMSYKFAIKELERSPGPVRYTPVQMNVYKRRAPQYTIPGQIPMRTSVRSPGPAAYDPPAKQCNRAQFRTIQSRTGNMPYITPEDNMPCINK